LQTKKTFRWLKFINMWQRASLGKEIQFLSEDVPGVILVRVSSDSNQSKSDKLTAITAW